MKAVVIGESSGATMDQIMAVYPRHKAVVDAFVARGEVIGIASPALAAQVSPGSSRPHKRSGPSAIRASRV